MGKHATGRYFISSRHVDSAIGLHTNSMPARFCLLEQILPEGISHPFAQTSKQAFIKEMSTINDSLAINYNHWFRSLPNVLNSTRSSVSILELPSRLLKLLKKYVPSTANELFIHLVTMEYRILFDALSRLVSQA